MVARCGHSLLADEDERLHYSDLTMFGAPENPRRSIFSPPKRNRDERIKRKYYAELSRLRPSRLKVLSQTD
jgi:hypothetical protein